MGFLTTYSFSLKTKKEGKFKETRMNGFLANKYVASTLTIVCLALLLNSQSASARGQYIDFWEGLYPDSRSSETGCQLCHQSTSGGDGWNFYGWTIRESFGGSTSVNEDFFRFRALVIDNDSAIDQDTLPAGQATPSEPTFAQEIAAGAQPGWREGENNIVRFRNNLEDPISVPPSELCGLVDQNSVRIPCPIFDPRPSSIAQGDIEIELEVVLDNLVAPLLAAKQPGNESELFVATQGGRIWRFQPSTGTQQLYLDVSDQLVSNFGNPFNLSSGNSGFDERGLLGFVFHPDFENNGRFYTYMSKDNIDRAPDFSVVDLGEEDHFSVISEWTITDDASSPVLATEQEILIIQQPQFNHNAGTLNFGPDNLLYISLGDGGGANDDGDGHGADGNGQQIENPLGSILRIDVDGNNSANGLYGIPQSNPFVNTDGLDEAIAVGFRNPFRFSINDLGNGAFDLYVGDVGQGEIEEVDLISSTQLGLNYGWRFKEGSFFFIFNDGDPFISDVPPVGVTIPLLEDPIAEYDHDEGVSVIGGFVYQGQAIPELQNKYVFGEYSRLFTQANGRLFYLDDDNEIMEFQYASQPPYFFTGLSVSLDKEIYVIGNQSIDVNSDSGVILRVKATEPDDEFCFPIIAENGNIATICL